MKKSADGFTKLADLTLLQWVMLGVATRAVIQDYRRTGGLPTHIKLGGVSKGSKSGGVFVKTKTCCVKMKKNGKQRKGKEVRG